MRSTRSLRNTDYRRNSRQSNPPGLNRHARRRLDRELSRLMTLDRCSFCSEIFPHNGKSTGGVDQGGHAVLACEACADNVTVVTGSGLKVSGGRNYDFFGRGNGDGPPLQSREEVEDLVATLQRAVAEADRQVEKVAKFSGAGAPLAIGLLDTVWKTDDRVWFEEHPARSHRLRLPFPGEITKKITVPEGHELWLVVRQVEPGSRIKVGIFLNKEVLPIPDVEAIHHALFDIAIEGSNVPNPAPINSDQLFALVERYSSLVQQQQ